MLAALARFRDRRAGIARGASKDRASEGAALLPLFVHGTILNVRCHQHGLVLVCLFEIHRVVAQDLQLGDSGGIISKFLASVK